MRKNALIGTVALLLAACSPVKQSSELAGHLKNPLYAEYYFDDLVERMVELEIQNDPVLQDSAKKDIVDVVRKEGLKKAQEATKLQREGKMGTFVPGTEQSMGEVLLLKNALYFGPDFMSVPGPEVHVYLSTVLDPREDKTFPDEKAVDLGVIHSPYASQTYDVPTLDNLDTYRTVVLWDSKLGRLHGFAQLSGD